MRLKAVLWATMGVYLSLTMAGCGSPSPIGFDRVAKEKLPIELSDWAKGQSDERPAVFARRGEDWHYVLIRGGKCPSSNYELKVTGAEGTGTPTLGIYADLGKPWWKHADTTPSYPEDDVRLKWRWGPIPERFGLHLGDVGLGMKLQKPVEGQPETVQVYTTDTPFKCGESGGN